VITYCTNIHPAESWQDTFANVRRYVPVVKEKVSPLDPFPVGLRLSGRAAAELDMESAKTFHEWCRSNGCFVATINGFPHGTFHRVPVKAAVYLPDWRSPERLHYTVRLAKLLTAWLPAGMKGSISTVPVGFKDCIGAADSSTTGKHLRAALEFLEHTAQATGKMIVLAMEPEPGCVLETTPDVVRFFEELDLPHALRPFLAVCYDCCHQALQYESPRQSLNLLAANDIGIGHVQVSSGLMLKHPDIKRMQRFSEPCYLHQTVGRRKDNTLVRYNDLDQAFAASPTDVLDWRIHFHIPVFIDQLKDCAGTQPFLREILPLFAADMPLEVETYTWSVLPPDLRKAALTESIVREILWVRTQRLAAHAPLSAVCA
jgi:sugar phosphate isomerase/epimerase